MKKSEIFAILLAMFVGNLAAKTFEITEFEVSEPINVANALTEKCGAEGDKAALLKNEVNVENLFANETMVVNAADTTSAIVLKVANNGVAKIVVCRASLMSEQFVTAKLKIDSPSPYELFVNGEMKMPKYEGGNSEIDLTMLPLRDYKVVVKLLVTDAETTLKASVDCGDKEADVYCNVDGKRRLKMSDIQLGKRAASVSLSADGKYLLTRYNDRATAKITNSYCVLSEVKTGKVIANRLNASADWSYGGNEIVYTINSEKGYDLYALDPVTMIERLVVADFPVAYGYVWNKDMDYIIYTKQIEGVYSDGVMQRYTTPDDRIPGNRDKSAIYKYNLRNGLSELIVEGSVFLTDVAANGKKMLYATIEQTPTIRPFNSNSFIDVDLETLEVDTLVTNTGMLSNALYSPDGSKILFLGSAAAFDNLGKNCGEHPIVNDFDVQAFIFDKATREVEPISLDFNPSIDRATWNRGDGNIYMYVTEGFYKNLYRYVVAKKRYEKLPVKSEVITNFSIAFANPSQIAYIDYGFDYASMVWVYDTKKMVNRLVDSPLQTTLDEVDFGKTEQFDFVNSRGDLIEGYICYPPQFDAAKKYPMIVYYYGGTTPTTKAMSNPYCGHMFAANGYVTYVLNPSGTIGYGQEFSARHVNAWGDYTADDIIEGVEQCLNAHDFIDKNRIGCIGASYGGFMTQYLQTRTDLFAAAVSHAGISNVTSYWGEGYWGYSYNSVAAADSYPWTNPELFTKHGSLFNADKINTPILLLHGTADTNVPVGESIQLFNALKILGKEVELVTVNGADHVIRDYEQLIPWHNTIMAFFAKWLKNDSAWWEHMYK